MSEPSGIAAGLGALAACVIADVLLSHEAAALVGTFAIAPFVTALLAGPAATLLVGIVATGCAAASPAWNMNIETSDWLVRLAVLVFATGFATFGSWLRDRSRGRSERLELLNSVGAVADGSLPLAETLWRVTEVIAPAFADACVVDAVHDGRAIRMATRAADHPDALTIEERLHRRPPTLPEWLVSGEPAWRDIPRWWPRVREEELRRLATSPEDLEFLRSLGIRSSIVAPIRARDRNLGTLTLLVAWSGRKYSAEDVRFSQILASRIGLALDNAGLFSNIESIERRMDTVMSILDEAVVIHGPSGELVFANPAAASTLGYRSPEEALATPWAEIEARYTIYDESGDELGADALAGDRTRSGDVPRVLRIIDRAQGHERWLRTKAQTIDGPTGDVLYSVSAIEDVTEVKRAEHANSLLARLGELLSEAIDRPQTLARIPRLLVPGFADWCSIEIPHADGSLRREGLAHRDPERERELRELRARFPIRADEHGPLGRALDQAEATLFTVDDQLLDEVSLDAEHRRALRELRISSAIVAPMTVAGTVVGALSFLNHEGSRVFDTEDLETAVELARRAALAIENARIADERDRVADALQRELLPPSLPRMQGWEVETMYEPAGEINEVGGDFYEVFEVADGWAVVLGDVSGKGAAAAAVTAEARHTIRTAGLLSGDPCRGLALLDEHLRERREVALCSVALLILPEIEAETESCEAEVFLAGHPHPLLLRDGRAEPVGKPGPLLGVVEEPRWVGQRVNLEPGDQLVLYTDGVIEARHESGERFGTERLRHELAGCPAPALAVERVRAALASFAASARQDDAALVALRCGVPLPSPLAGEPLAGVADVATDR